MMNRTHRRTGWAECLLGRRSARTLQLRTDDGSAAGARQLGHCGSGLAWLLAALVATLLSLSAPACAIDNPDAPDRVAAFEQRAQPFEQALAATDGGAAASGAGEKYRRFLQSELDAAYRLLLVKLEGPARDSLVTSQRHWTRFRDAEQAFIDRQWTQARNGSSATLSRAGYRNAVTRQRIVQLLQYAAEYP